jgi:hypothetical protein
MPRRDPRASEYTQKRALFARPILKSLRKAIHDGGAGIEEAIKWGMPSCLYRGRIVCGIAGFKAHCALWFWKGKAVTGKKPSEGMGNFGRITSLKELPSAARIKGYVRKAMKLIDQVRPPASHSSRRPRSIRRA